MTKKTIYEVNNKTIFWKNFLAGLAHSAGAWFFNILVLTILAYVLIPFFGPYVKQIIDLVNNLPKDIENTIVRIEKQ